MELIAGQLWLWGRNPHEIKRSFEKILCKVSESSKLLLIWRSTLWLILKSSRRCSVHDTIMFCLVIAYFKVVVVYRLHDWSATRGVTNYEIFHQEESLKSLVSKLRLATKKQAKDERKERRLLPLVCPRPVSDAVIGCCSSPVCHCPSQHISHIMNSSHDESKVHYNLQRL